MQAKLIIVLLFSFATLKSFAQPNDKLALSFETMTKFAELPFACIGQEYPYKLGQVLSTEEDLKGPRELHPIFYGCFDWHSSVHGHWLLAKGIKKFPNTPMSIKAIELFKQQFTANKVAKELAYFEPQLNKSFERTYGWAWILKLQSALIELPEDKANGWSKNLEPLVQHIVESYKKFLPKLVYPIRVGEHTNTAFGLSLALDYARVAKDTAFEQLIVQRAKDFYLTDAACPLGWEPSGYDFLSPCLQEAELMSKVLPKKEYKEWLQEFLPQLFEEDFNLIPGKVIDRTDGKLVHLDGLNFSRAWCLYTIAKKLPQMEEQFVKVADAHVLASKEFVSDSDYMGSHWLASFLIYALEAREGL
jgi:hypothetical protein